MDIDRLKNLLTDVQTGALDIGDAVEKLRALPYDSVGDFARLDTHRAVRTGAPEVVYCPGKSPEQVARIIERLASHSERVLATRATVEQFDAVRALTHTAAFHALSRLITVGDPRPPVHPERFVAVLTAGTADTPVGEEAAMTLEWHGSRVERLYDVGVAGLHRLLEHVELLQSAQVLVVCAGMEGALSSVVAGLVSCPVVAVPTSVGYGASFGGVAALLAMLNSCSGGVAVVNIDNGFGAGCYAHRINSVVV
ncbi:MAG TPA: nickel pincer cofactor biosynthesis protein LarB [Capsulimonadaceae bacterium]